MRFIPHIAGFVIAALMWSVIGLVLSLFMWNAKGMVEWGVLVMILGAMVKGMVEWVK